MMKLIRRMYDWMIRLAETRYAPWALAAVSFVEASVFPIPPDIMLIPMCLAERRKSIFFATVCTVTSVLGGLLGYAIGRFAFEAFGHRILEVYGQLGNYDALKAKYDDYGGWIILAKGATPIPFKILTILSGAMQLSLPVFIISSIGARAMRFYLVAGLLWWKGDKIRVFIEKYLGWVTLAFLVLVISGFVALKYILK